MQADAFGKKNTQTQYELASMVNAPSKAVKKSKRSQSGVKTASRQSNSARPAALHDLSKQIVPLKSDSPKNKL